MSEVHDILEDLEYVDVETGCPQEGVIFVNKDVAKGGTTFNGSFEVNAGEVLPPLPDESVVHEESGGIPMAHVIRPFEKS